MAGLGVFESYERQFSTITADITARIGKIPNLTGTEKKTAIGVVQGNIDEASELLEQMDLEIHDVPVSVRPQLKQRLENYRHELKRIGKEFKQSQVALGGSSMRSELLGPEELHTSEDQRAYLLEGTERLQKSSDRLEEGIRIAKETEEIGMDVMDTLQRDRETIQRMRGRLRETDADLSKGSRIVRRISRSLVPDPTHKGRGRPGLVTDDQILGFVEMLIITQYANTVGGGLGDLITCGDIRIVQHKIFFIVGAIVILAVIGLLIFGIVMIKKNSEG